MYSLSWCHFLQFITKHRSYRECRKEYGWVCFNRFPGILNYFVSVNKVKARLTQERTRNCLALDHVFPLPAQAIKLLFTIPERRERFPAGTDPVGRWVSLGLRHHKSDYFRGGKDSARGDQRYSEAHQSSRRHYRQQVRFVTQAGGRRTGRGPVLRADELSLSRNVC